MSIKHSVYLRKELYDFVQVLCEQTEASIPERLSSLIGEHREISKACPDLLQGARIRVCHDTTRDFKVQSYSERIQLSLVSEDSRYLKKFATEFSDKNISVATNLMVSDLQAIGNLLADILGAMF